MGIGFHIDVEEGFIYAFAEGEIRAEDVRAHRKNLRADPDFSPSLGHIMEFRLSGFRISDQEGKSLAAALPLDHTRKTAIVAVGPNKDWAIRYRRMIVDRIQVEVFTDLGSARKWITSD